MSSEVPKGWQLKTFGEIAKVKNGYAFKSADFTDLESDSVLVIRMSDLKNGSISKQSAKRVPENIVSGLERFKLQRGDFVFGMSGSLRNYAVVPDSSVPMYLNQRVGKLEATVSDTEFLRYLYTSEKFISNVEKSASGNAQLNISGKLIESFEVLLPPLTEQKCIAEVLSSVDESIQATQRLIEQAERVKQGLMEELLTGGLGSEVIERGEVPEGWANVALSDISVIAGEYGANASKEEFNSSLPRYIRITDINSDGTLDDSVKVSLNEEKAAGYELEHGDIVLARSGATVGKSFVYDDAYGRCVFAGYLLRFRLDKNKACFSWLKYWLQSSIYWGWVENNQRAGAQPNINAKEYGGMPLALPPLDIQKKIAGRLGSIDTSLFSLRDSIEAYGRTKKGLMDDLLTGKVRTL